MKARTLLLLLAGCACLASSGCTYRAWYAGFQAQQRNECYKNTSQNDIQKCLDSVNGLTYEQYRKSREDSNKQSE